MLVATKSHHSWRALAIALIAALLLHALGLGLMHWQFNLDPDDETPTVRKPQPKPPQELKVTTVTEEEVAELLKPKPEEKKEPKPKEEPKPEPPKPEAPVPEPPQPQLDKKVVIQETNEQKPTKADYLSEQANATPEETRAQKTTMKDVLPGKEAPEPEDDAGQPDPDPVRDSKDEDAKEATNKPKELAMSVPSPKPSDQLSPPERIAPKEPTRKPDTSQEQLKESDDGAMVYKDYRKNKTDELVKIDPDSDESPIVRRPDPQAKPQQGQPNPNKIFNAPNVAEYERAFGKQDDAPTADEPQNKRRRMFSNIKRRQKNLRASLENMIPEVKPGNHTSVNAHPAVYAGYMASIHRKIHERWANDYLMALDTSYPRSHPLQNPMLHVLLEFVIEAKSGKFEAVNIVRSSGELMFDAEAVDTAWAVGDRPNPPPQIVSPNGKIYVHWNFWRDGRQCGVFGASIFIVDDKGQKTQKRADATR